MKNLRALVIGLVAAVLALGAPAAVACQPGCAPVAACPMMAAMARSGVTAALPCHGSGAMVTDDGNASAPPPACCRLEGGAGSGPVLAAVVTGPNSFDLDPAPSIQAVGPLDASSRTWRPLAPVPPAASPPGLLLLLHQVFLL